MPTTKSKNGTGKRGRGRKSPGLDAKAKQAVEARKRLQDGKEQHDHPAARRKVLKRAKMSEGSSLTAEQAERADSAPSGLKGERLAALILHGTKPSENPPNGASSTEPGPKRTGIVAAIEKVLARAPEEGLDATTITDRILKRGLAPDLKGKTPRNTVAARLSTGKQFKKVSRGHYVLDKGAK